MYRYETQMKKKSVKKFKEWQRAVKLRGVK